MLRRLAIAAPTIVLLVMATTQMILARTADLSPWKGGGFGMFSSVDGAPFRWTRIYVTAPQRSEEIALPPSLADQADRVVTWPRRPALAALAAAIADRERRHDRPVQDVRIEVWRTVVTPNLDVTEALLRELTLRVDDDNRSNDQ